MNFIIRILGKSSEKYINNASIFNPLKEDKKQYLVLLLGMSDGIELPINSSVAIGDNLGEFQGILKLIEVTLYGKHLLHETPLGTRSIALFEIIKVNNKIDFENSLVTLDRYDYVNSRFWIYEGNFKELYNEAMS